MKKENTALLHACINSKTTDIDFPNLEGCKVKDADPDLELSYKRAVDDATAMRKSLMKPFWFLYTPIMIVGSIIMLIGAMLLDGESRIAAVATMVCGAVLFLLFAPIAFKYMRKVNANEEYVCKLNRIQGIRDSIDLSLGAPMDANKIDIIYPASKLKRNGERGLLVTQKTFEFKVFKKDGDVCIIGGNSLYSLQNCVIRSFKINPKQVSFNEWTKKEGYLSPSYKQYKIGYYSKTNTYFIKNTGELCISLDNTDYYMTVLPWSINDLEKILEITATSPEKI